jgi:putative transposase
MAGHMTSLFCHLIWSTKHRQPTISEVFRDDLFGYIGGTLKRKNSRLLCAGGIADHVHLLVSYPPNMDISKIVNVIKSNSSGWIHRTIQQAVGFAWQNGYGAFSVSYSQMEKVKSYIRNQNVHHKTRGFQDEFLAFLIKHHVDYDERYVWE